LRVGRAREANKLAAKEEMKEENDIGVLCSQCEERNAVSFFRLPKNIAGESKEEYLCTPCAENLSARAIMGGKG